MTRRSNYTTVPFSLSVLLLLQRGTAALYCHLSQQLKSMANDDSAPSCDIITYNTALSALSKSNEYCLALELLDDMIMHGPLPDAFSYVTVISTCARLGQWKEVLHLLQNIRNRKERGLYNVAFNASIRTFAIGGAWREAKSLIDVGKYCNDRDIRIDFHTFLSVIRATAASGEWRQALHILREAEGNLGSEHVPTTQKNFLRSGAISVLGRAGQWKRALVLLRRYQSTTEKACV